MTDDDVRKTVTVVFCDMVGSTALGERSDPEVLRELMRRYHATLRACLERHGGTVEKFVGDAAMAVFGVPHVHEDDPLRAVRAAVEMRDAVRPLGLDVRIGVNTGEVVTGRGETLVTGDAVNVAARFEQAARAGEILIGETTAALVGGAVQSEAIAPLALKGKAEPVPAYRVLSLVAGGSAFPRSTTTPFVGRDDELAQLERALATAVERRIPQLATVVGPPGIGKSRLVREFLGRAGARVLAGRCLSYGEGITYWPLAEIVSQIGELREVLSGTPDAALVEARLGAALGAPGATASPDEIAWGFRKVCEALARERPLIVMFDDIHWGEPALLDLIEYVAVFAQDVPLFVLCTARPELFERRAAWATPRPNALVLALEPLGSGETARLVGALGTLTPQQTARVVDAAEGNPLFVEQLVAMQRDKGDAALTIPPTLHALLAARVDALMPEERAVLERGSVEGRTFHRGAVASLLPETQRRNTGTELLTLVRKELIRPDAATIPGDDAFRFGHVLIRDAAYESIPKRHRAELHIRFADWLSARLGEDAPVEIVGYHLEQAYRYGQELGAPDAALGIRAAERLAAAARGARLRGDMAAAAILLRRATALVPDDDPLLGGMLLVYGETLHRRGDLAPASEMLERSAALARTSGDRRLEWRARIELADIRLWREPEGASEHAMAVAREAIAYAEPLADHDVLAHAWYLIADAAVLRSAMGECAHAFAEALRHARATGDRELEIDIVTHSGPPFLFGETDVAEGMRYVNEVTARLGDVPAVRAFLLHMGGHLRARLGELDDARAVVLAYREQYRELGHIREFAMACGCVADVLRLADDWTAVERVLAEGKAILEQMGEKAHLSTMYAELGEACLHLGRADEAEQWAARSAEIGASDDVMNEATWRSVKAAALSARGDRDGAVPLARRAVELADTTDYLDMRADMRLVLATVLGPGDEALRAVDEARALYERKGNRVAVTQADAVRRELAGAR